MTWPQISFLAKTRHLTIAFGDACFLVSDNTESNLTLLRENYHLALEVRERVLVERLTRTLVGLRSIALKLTDFNWWVRIQGQISLERVHKAVQLLLTEMVAPDLRFLSSKLKMYEDAYEQKRAGAADDMFVKLTSGVSAALELLYHRLKLQTGVNLDKEFTQAWLDGNDTFVFNLPPNSQPVPWESSNNVIFDLILMNMQQVQFAAEAIKSWIVDTRTVTGETDPTVPTYIPDSWHPGKDWDTPCNRSIEHLTTFMPTILTIHSNSIRDFEPNNRQFMYQLFALLMDFQKAKQCRLLYSSSLEEARKAITDVETSASDLIQVGICVATYIFLLL